MVRAALAAEAISLKLARTRKGGASAPEAIRFDFLRILLNFNPQVIPEAN
jgi:hypothetical protein